MCDFMQSCIQLYSDLIEEVKPGSSRSILPADLPTGVASGGGNAPITNYGDRWKYFPDHKAWRRIHDKPRTAYSPPLASREAQRQNPFYPPESLT